MWTEETIEALRRLALEGRSASSIAAALGMLSRNAVIRQGESDWDQARPRQRVGARRGGGPARSGRGGRQSLAPALTNSGGRDRKATWIFAEAQGGVRGNPRNQLQMAARRSDERGFRILRPRDGEGTRLLRRPLPDGLSAAEGAGQGRGASGAMEFGMNRVDSRHFRLG
jgi:hypothetical protein